MRLEGKVAVITGAGSGTGRSMAFLFAQEGARVVGCDIAQDRIDSVTSEVRAGGGEMIGLVADVSVLEDVERLVETAIAEFGQLDVLCNNAGIMDRFEGVATVSDETWQKLMAVNAFGPMAASRAAVPHMKERGSGSIINVSSAAGVGGGAAGVAYTASKHALVGITRNTAFAYAQAGIRCNAIIAGGIRTDIMSGVDPSEYDQEALAQFGKWHAVMPNTLEPEDIAHLALYLASDEAIRINGALIAADAGWQAA